MATYRTSAAGGSSSGTGDRTCTLVPAVGDLWVVFCYVAANTNDTPTCSDNNGGSYTRIQVANCITSAINYRLSAFVRTTRHINTTSTVVTVATGSNTSGVVEIIAISGMTRANSLAIRSTGKQDNQAAGTAAPVLNQTSLTTNLTLVAQGSGDTTTTPPTNWTEAQDSSQTNDPVSLETAYRDSGFVGTTITFGAASSTTFCSMAIEIDSSLHVLGADTINNWSEAQLLGHGLIFSDNGTTLADAYAQDVGILLTFSDDLNNWGDSYAQFLGTPLLTVNEWDYFTLLDGIAGDINQGFVGNLGARWQDSLVYDLEDAVDPALTLSLSDDANNLADDMTGDRCPHGKDNFAYNLLSDSLLTQEVSDSLNNWIDDLTGDLHNRWQDSLATFLDSAGGITLTASDSFTLTDGSATTSILSYEVIVWDGQDLNNWDDALAKTLSGGAAELTLTLSDSINFCTDDLCGDLHNRWNDSLTKTLDSAGFLTLTLSDTLNNWNDSIRIGYGLIVSDTLTLTDAFQKTLITGGFAVWQNIAAVTLTAANLASVTLLLENTGDPGDVMYESADDISLLTEDTDSASVFYEDTDTAAIRYEDTDAV